VVSSGFPANLLHCSVKQAAHHHSMVRLLYCASASICNITSSSSIDFKGKLVKNFYLHNSDRLGYLNSHPSLQPILSDLWKDVKRIAQIPGLQNSVLYVYVSCTERPLQIKVSSHSRSPSTNFQPNNFPQSPNHITATKLFSVP
jgi:hypothetical protein